ncbi:MAG: cytochrome C, partial [Luminiphilus sp.]|nr:cytochrome C [Luminiphilus sp.]
MFRWARLWIICLTFLSWNAFADDYSSALNKLGRTATAAELSAWDIDVRPDFVGLPPGSGSVEEGEALWLDQCANCHGDFGDSNEVFSPI